MAPGPLFVIGSGPMIGSHIARLFATHGFTQVALFSRSPDNLARDAAFITTASPSTTVRTYATDVTADDHFTSTLEKAVGEVGSPEVVVYNAARVNFAPFGQYAAADVRRDFEIPNLGLHTTATVLLPRLRALAESEPEKHAALYVTSGAIIHQPLMSVYSLCMAKAAQASLTRVLAEETKGLVHVALVTVGGTVTFEEEVNNPSNIATKFWELYQQKKGSWEFEMKCGW